MEMVEVTRAPLAQRLIGSGLLFTRRAVVRALWLARPRLPGFLLRPYVDRKVAAALAEPAVMDDARMHMDHLLGAIGRSSEVEDASRGYVEHWTRFEELKWRPRLVTRQAVEGAEHLRAAHALGRGVMLSFVHHAQYDGIFKSVARASGVPVKVVAADRAAPGPNLFQHYRVVGSGGGLISAAVGIAGLVEELKGGAVVASAIDVPGSSVTTFAGRQVKCSSGPARSATLAGAPVVMLTSHRGPDGPVIKLGEPMLPEDFSSVDELLQELVRRHEGPLLEWPEVAYLPTVCWRPVD